MSNKTKVILVILIASIISGGNSPITKIGLIKIPPFTFSFLRFFIASLIILPFYIKKIGRLDKSFLSLITLSFLPTINVALFVLGLRTTTASIGQMLYGGTPLLAGIFAYFLLNQRLALKKWIFILIGLFGVFLVVILPLIEKNSVFSGDMTGNLIISAGIILYALYTTLSKNLQKKYSPFVITSTFILVAVFVFFFLSLTEFDLNMRWWKEMSISSFVAVGYLGILSTLVGYILHQYAIKFGGPILASLSLYLTPIFTYILSFILLGERLTLGLIVGTILVFLSVALTTYTK